MEIIIPFIMMWVLSLVHSQIVATSPSTEIKKPRVKQRQYKRRRSYMKRRRRPDEPDEPKFKTDVSCNTNEVKIEKELFGRIELLDLAYKKYAE